jgi:hypothetical protein
MSSFDAFLSNLFPFYKSYSKKILSTDEDIFLFQIELIPLGKVTGREGP